MPSRPSLPRLLAAATLVLATVACGSTKHSTSATTTTAAGSASSATTAPPKITGHIVVDAAASLTEALTTLRTDFMTAHPGVTVTINFGSSGDLATSITGGGAPADVFASADTKTMGTVTKAGAADDPTVFARNRLAILVAKGNPKHIETVQDLGRKGVVFVLCAATAPCGKFGAMLLANQHVTAKPKSYEDNVKAVVSRVVLGEADAGIVYVSDAVAAKGKALGVTIPDAQNIIASYPIAALKRSKNAAADAAFIAYVESPAGQKVLAADGFLPPR